MEWQGEIRTLIEVAGAMLLGGMIGLERELSGKPAGFRTHMLVAGASATLVGLGVAIVVRLNTAGEASVRLDPVRIIQAIIMGIGFLGAGTIMRERRSSEVEGLTTGASLLLSASLGIAVAVRAYVLAIGVTLLALLVLRVFNRIERRLAGGGRNGSSGQ